MPLEVWGDIPEISTNRLGSARLHLGQALLSGTQKPIILPSQKFKQYWFSSQGQVFQIFFKILKIKPPPRTPPKVWQESVVAATCGTIYVRTLWGTPRGGGGSGHCRSQEPESAKPCHLRDFNSCQFLQNWQGLPIWCTESAPVLQIRYTESAPILSGRFRMRIQVIKRKNKI